jgi:uncharacterized protein YdcH (DUF465 family)
MIDRIRGIISRFAENENAIRELMQTDPVFDALCEEYATVSKALEELTRMKGQGLNTTALRERHAAVEEELLTVIEGYRPV